IGAPVAPVAAGRLERADAPGIGPFPHRALGDPEVLGRLPERQPFVLRRSEAPSIARRHDEKLPKVWRTENGHLRETSSSWPLLCERRAAGGAVVACARTSAF